MADRIVAYLGLPLSHTDPTLSWRLVGEDQNSPSAQAVLRDAVAKQTQSTHGSEQVVFASIPPLVEAPRRVDGLSADALLKKLQGTLVLRESITVAHLLTAKLAALPHKSALRRLYAARVRKACPGHLGNPMQVPPDLAVADNATMSCGTCTYFCPTRNVCKMFGDYPVPPSLVCSEWEG